MFYLIDLLRNYSASEVKKQKWENINSFTVEAMVVLLR